MADDKVKELRVAPAHCIAHEQEGFVLGCGDCKKERRDLELVLKANAEVINGNMVTMTREQCGVSDLNMLDARLDTLIDMLFDEKRQMIFEIKFLEAVAEMQEKVIEAHRYSKLTQGVPGVGTQLPHGVQRVPGT